MSTHQCPLECPPLSLSSPGRELATGRKIAIKKIKVGQFKDGLDMSAVREVKYLRELQHPNIIEVRIFARTNAATDTECLALVSLFFSSCWTYSPQRQI